MVRLEVADTGLGMAPEVLSHIFDPFFTTKERGRGTGLGLATVDAAVRAQEGEIEVRSTPGHGTTFLLRLPLLKDEGSEPLPASESVPGRELVLIVDDEVLVREPMRRLLEHSGYRVVEAKSGADALGSIEHGTEKPALMILDLVMPGMSAVETFRLARELIPGLPVLFCSGFVPEELLASIQSEPGTARLGKPFSAQELQAALRALL
jgi:two-component system cell cycle sensor histidine kinase/response regulator CckA